MLSAAGTFVPKLNPFQRPGGRSPGMTFGPSMPTVDYGSGPVTDLPGNLFLPGTQGTLDPDRFGEKVWLDTWSWHYKPVKNEGGGWRNPVLKPTMPGWEEGTYLESGNPAMQGDPYMGSNWIQYITDDPASPYYQPPFGGIQQPGEVYMEGDLPPSLPGGRLAGPGGLPFIPPEQKFPGAASGPVVDQLADGLLSPDVMANNGGGLLGQI